MKLFYLIKKKEKIQKLKHFEKHYILYRVFFADSPFYEMPFWPSWGEEKGWSRRKHSSILY